MSYGKFISKKIFFSLIFFAGVGFTPNFCYAFWPADWAMNAGLDTMMKTMKEAILKAAVAALKEEATKTINETVGNAVSQGNGTGALFVTNWENFLVNDPQRKVDLYMNDFFSNIFQGRSTGDYSKNLNLFGSSGGSQRVAGASITREGIVKGTSISSLAGGNYASVMEEGAKNLTINRSKPVSSGMDYTKIFTSNNWIEARSYYSNDANNPYGLNNIAMNEFLSESAKQVKIAETQGIAYKGFLPSKSGDTVITPGSTIEAIQAQAEDVGNKILAGASSIPEVITALVTRMAVKTIQQGIGQAGSYARRETNNKTNNYSQQARSSSDPKQMFKPSY
jgi:hypothetical protein